MRNKRLDILRAIAVILVLGRHGPAPEFWGKVGWVGVDLFFILSGFLISGLLFTEYKKTGGINWGRFFVRRGFKIYPAFYAMIFATFLWQLAKHQEIRWNPYLPEILFYQSYQPDRLWAHTWSLAVEEHFYILLPALLLVILVVKRKKRSKDPFRIIPAIALVLTVGCLLQRLHLVNTLPASHGWWQAVGFPTHLRIDSLFLGVTLGYLHHFHASVVENTVAKGWFRVGLLLTSASLISTCAFKDFESPFMLSYGLTAVSIGFGGILVLVLYSDPWKLGWLPRWLRNFNMCDLIAYVGMYSYSIYLWHAMISTHITWFLRLLWPNIGNGGFFRGYVLASLVGGIVLSRLIEYPVLQVRDRFFPSTDRSADQALAQTHLSS